MLINDLAHHTALSGIEWLEPEPSVTKSIDDFAGGVRAAIRAFWQGDFDRFTFVDNMRAAIERNFKIAWLEGAKQCGILESELTPDELVAREQAINSQFPYLVEFSLAIQEGSKANGGKLGPLLTRGKLWINRYNEVRHQAMTLACKNQKLEWRVGISEHCRTCLKLNGRVMRASRWQELDVWPQDTRPGKLACNGYNCKCTLKPTKARATPGPLPRIG